MVTFMHIPDGFLDMSILVVCAIISLIVIAISIKKVQQKFDDKKVSVLAVLTAVVFAAQMINWPVGPGGTTAHLVGGALISMFLGPYAAVLSMTVILLIQSLLFNDGGLLALGANILNMGIVDVFVGYSIFKFVVERTKNKNTAITLGAFLGGWLGITLAAFMCGVELGLSTLFPYNIVVTTSVMTTYHGFLGIIEGIITAFAVGYVYRVRPDLLTTLSEVVKGESG